MREDKLGDLSMELSVDVLQLTKELRTKHENVISNQIGRSATSICANIAESKYAHGRADFIAKLEISLKDAKKLDKFQFVRNGYFCRDSKAEDRLVFNSIVELRDSKGK